MILNVLIASLFLYGIHSKEISSTIKIPNEILTTQKDSNPDYTSYDISICPPHLPSENVEWKLGSSVIVSYLPHVEPGNCTPPRQCRVSTTINRQLFLQEGDTLKIMLQNPAILSDQTTETEVRDIDLESLLEVNETSLAADDIQSTPQSSSPLTIWRVSSGEWSSCSTREGGQIAESDENGVVTLGSEHLELGTSYFIGRSSWSSSECFKMKVIVRSADCGEGSICSGKGLCHTNATMSEYTCTCCDGYTGAHCEEKDACMKKPCQNSGICIDIEEGHNANTFQCICVYGFKGKTCEQEDSLCASSPCQNGGTCIGNHTQYHCNCPIGFYGALCTERNDTVLAAAMESEQLKGSCSDGECVHGVCIQISPTDFRCFCQPGFGGSRCDVEYDECFSSPCLNEGTCLDGIGSFQCICGAGFTGKLCETKVELCTDQSCPGNRICVDRGNAFTCECLAGVTADDCSQDYQLCSPNPCKHGGSCYIIPETVMFYCACRPGYTGQTCQDASILESVSRYDDLEPVKALDGDANVIGHTHHRWKSIYTAGATLACAFIIFFLVVTVWHCRTVGYTPRCLWISRSRSSPSFRRMHLASMCEKKRKARLSALRLDEPDGSSVPMTPQNQSESVYCHMDVCDSQEAPLMK